MYAFDGLVTSQLDSDSADAAIAMLRELARAQEAGIERLQESKAQHRTYEYSCPLQRLPPSEWRSLGGYFDYCHWADRERFVELDRAIAAAQRGQIFELETNSGMC
jgi:hypothetical protein